MLHHKFLHSIALLFRILAMAAYTVPTEHMLHPSFSHKTLQAWQSVGDIPKSSLVFPIFLVDDVSIVANYNLLACVAGASALLQPSAHAFVRYPVQDSAKQAIGSMPDQYRWGVARLAEALDEPVADGLTAVLLFGVIDVRIAVQEEHSAGVARLSERLQGLLVHVMAQQSTALQCVRSHCRMLQRRTVVVPPPTVPMPPL